MGNPLKAKLKAVDPLFGTLLTMPSLPLAQCIAGTGLDWVAVDLEHSPIDVGSLHGLMLATAGSACVPMVRVPSDNDSVTRQALDSGAYGLLIPMVKTAEDVRRALSAMRYPPLGSRGVGPIYAAQRWGVTLPQYLNTANDELAAFVIIEDIAAIDHLDEILAVIGVDAAIVAPYDLSASMGWPGDYHRREVSDVIANAEERILASGVALGGLATSSDDVIAKRRRGYRVITLGYDLLLVQAGVRSFLQGVQ